METLKDTQFPHAMCAHKYTSKKSKEKDLQWIRIIINNITSY